LAKFTAKYLKNIYDYTIFLLALANFGNATRNRKNRNNPICVVPPKVTKASTVIRQVSLLPAVLPKKLCHGK
jgi:hypothetical protein